MRNLLIGSTFNYNFCEDKFDFFLAKMEVGLTFVPTYKKHVFITTWWSHPTFLVKCPAEVV